MTDIADNVIANGAKLDTLITAVTDLTAAIKAIAAPTVDLSGVNAKLDTLIADMSPTPTPVPAPTPEPSPAPVA